jgi:hypothetical protein
MAITAERGMENGNVLAAMLGTYWTHFFPDQDTLTSLMTARGEPFYQVYLGLMDIVACKSRFNIPVFKSKYWSLFTVKESEKNSGFQMSNLYNTSQLTYQNASKPAYGDKENSKYFSYSIDPAITSVHAVYNRVVNPSLVWMSGADFMVDGDRHTINFYTDPFENELVPKRDILSPTTGEVIDREIALWLSLSEWDLQLVYEQFGYALGIWMKSSTFYKEFLSAIWDSLVLGPTELTLKLAFSALSGIPFARDHETVLTVIDESPNYKHVETDKNLYTFKASTTITVKVGDALNPGDTMCSAMQFIEPTVDEPVSIIPQGLAISSNIMRPAGINGAIVLGNKDVEVQYLGLDANNKAIVQFEVNGFPEDVAAFWRRAHLTGLAQGHTLADVLDTRAVRASPTTPYDLPATINPLTFAASHIFINNLYFVYMRPTDFAVGAPGLGAMDLMYPYLPAQTTYMIFVETQQDTDYYRVGDQVASLGFFKGTSLSDSAGRFAVDLGPTIRAIPGRCR